MSLPNPPSGYDPRDQATTRGALEQMDSQNHKRGKDIEVGSKARVIFTDTATGKRYPLVVTNGALTLGPHL
jgi:hypothetical protein